MLIIASAAWWCCCDETELELDTGLDEDVLGLTCWLLLFELVDEFGDEVAEEREEGDD